MLSMSQMTGFNVGGEHDPYWGDVLFYAPLKDSLYVDKKLGITIAQTGASGSTIILSNEQPLFGGQAAKFDPLSGWLNNHELYFSIPFEEYDWAGAFTVEFWLYPQTTGNTQYIFAAYGASGTNLFSSVFCNTDGTFGATMFGTTVYSVEKLTLNTWNFCAISVRSGTLNVDLSVNGKVKNSYGTVTSRPSVSQTFHLGQISGSFPGNYSLKGYLREFRITKNVARYTADFTPPTAPFPDS